MILYCRLVYDIIVEILVEIGVRDIGLGRENKFDMPGPGMIEGIGAEL